MIQTPRVTVHYAQSLDGRIATCTGDSQWIGGPASLRLAHQLRAEHAAVLVVEPDDRGQVDLRRLLACLGQDRGIDSVLIEGGGSVITSALREGLVERLVVCIAARLIGSGVAAVGDLGVTRLSESPGFREAQFSLLEGDVIFEGRLGA